MNTKALSMARNIYHNKVFASTEARELAKVVMDEAIFTTIRERYKLSEIEIKVVKKYVENHPIIARKLAELLHKGIGTINNHTKHIYRKMGVCKRRDMLEIYEDIRMDVYLR